MSTDFRRFQVARKQRESRIISSFFLRSTDDAPLWNVEPGQYLTLRVPGQDGPVNRRYSVSGSARDPHYYRITVKREGPPADSPDAPSGTGSSWLHDQVSEGDFLEIAAPRGDFVLDRESTRPVILLSGGVGLTPLVSMLHDLRETTRDVWFIHACENGDVHALKEEIDLLATGANGRIRIHNIYRIPTDNDREAAAFDSEGMIGRPLLQSLLPLDDYEVYMCGPTPFMTAMFDLLRSLGVDPVRINYEFFGKATTLGAAPEETQQSPGAEATPDGHVEVVFARSGSTASWTNPSMSLLELAENAGLPPEYSCRDGICNTCMSDLVEGEVEYFEEPLDTIPDGKVLLCCSRPKGRVVLDI